MESAQDHWLNRKRLTVYPRLVVAVYAVVAAVWLLRAHALVDANGKPLGADFVTFWAASHLALTGHAVDAYSVAKIALAERLAVPASHEVFAWYYPPAFYLLIEPLARLPYLLAYVVFVLGTLAAYVAVFRRVTADRTALWALLAFSGVLLNLFQGQNAFLTAALAAGSLLCLQRRPRVAGVLLGLLAVKPHLALLFPVALAAVGAWEALAAAASTALVVTGVSMAVLGAGTLSAFLGSLGEARAFVERGSLPWEKMPTVFALCRMAGAPVWLAYSAHAAMALLAAAAVWTVWRRCEDWQLRFAVLMTATFFVSPYLYDYDLAWLAFPIAWLAAIGLRDGWRSGERELLVGAWALPLVVAPLAFALRVQVAPLLLGGLLCVMVRRARWAATVDVPVAGGQAMTLAGVSG